uniref:uncharacterized protein LOC120822404 n=1 Tax=Gasterosteus aculeatus aculeatus TaxID=481459 RepID=UPI001A98B7DD|nr:uncharacterized protein LOC120822404 [Gasterosteus aculeatus aculeatus]
MLTNWLTFTAILAASANTERAAIGRGTLTVAPTVRVTGHREVQLTLDCGDGRNAGAVQHWHTPFGDIHAPFGDIHAPGSHGKPAPVVLQRDGSLTIPNASSFHRGVYYCLLRHTTGTTLRPYDLHVDGAYQRGDAFRFRRDVRSEEQTEAAVSHGHFAGAVAASVLVTFAVGFGAGALTRTPVLRCLGAVTTRLRSPRQHHRRTDTPEGDFEATMTTKLPTFNNQAINMVQESDDDSADCTVAETSSSTPTPLQAKPQRSFRQKADTTAYLEGWDHMEKSAAEGHMGRNKVCDGEARGQGDYYLEDGGSQSETEDKCSESNEDVGQRRGSTEEKGRDQEEVNDGAKRKADGETDVCSSKQEGGGARSSSPPPDRHRRVIRLYQYDEEGRRYGHLPDANPEPGPAQRLKQRSLSLTRLNAIMAAASTGPLDTRETGAGEERPRFHMEI